MTKQNSDSTTNIDLDDQEHQARTELRDGIGKVRHEKGIGS